MNTHKPMNELLGPDFHADNSQMEGATLGDILRHASVLPEHDPIRQLEPETPKVDRMLTTFDVQWRTTIDALRLRATQLHDAADDLEHRANNLEEARTFLTDVKNTVLFEIESRQRAASLMFVNPPKND